MSYQLGEIADFLQAYGGVFHGERSQLIARIAPLKTASPDSITFLSNRHLLSQLQDTQAASSSWRPGPKSRHAIAA